MQNAGGTRDAGSNPWVLRSPGRRNGIPLQYSGLENSVDRGGWRATVHGLTESDTTEHAHMYVQIILPFLTFSFKAEING